MEHSALDLDRAAHLIRTADAAGITPFVRVPEVDAPLIKKLLNLGAAGIVLPHANRDNCAELLKAMKFAPDGERGACQITRAAGYVRGGWDAYAERANREVMAIRCLRKTRASRISKRWPRCRASTCSSSGRPTCRFRSACRARRSTIRK
jgi:2-keto-3-deoxy-L-rhamnonate aldolase RhmA